MASAGTGWDVPWALSLIGIVTVGVVVAQDPSHWLVRLDKASSDSADAASRMEVWNEATCMIQGCPFTGTGLSAFPVVLDALYPSFLMGPDARIPHAPQHPPADVVDLGIGGLMAFVRLWVIVGAHAVQAYRRARDPLVRGAVAGLAAGCVGYLAYGLTDSMALTEWEKPMLWVMVGLIVAAARLATDGGTRGEWETENPELGPENSALSPQSSVPIPHSPSLAQRGGRWRSGERCGGRTGR
ncbi:MAG: hypothetical protein M1380_01730 [Chloroflexi bacterium]|nr:hypothetical protein [Chloroflexota bacterium]